ncbi:MAG TPA: hypothetical protein PLU85_04745 [Bacteroidia bacterium]|nr:hypothetical protein [Bacteroidia bacterium]MBP7714829.1 hypothetical protein [Bacteroidia bacterium]MBP8667578.1 hypothetical protein [Bacteroidia bacterium]HOZ83407.1 hypothetical protein [Bacteroidia bacterium]HOZ91515.1 hypothetical protein [Bacteroidia bacterium]
MIVFVGYLASAFLAVSLLMSNAFKFRWYNLAGQIAFIIYGYLINAMPVIIANVILMIINIYQIIQLYKSKEAFDVIPIKESDPLAERFIERNKKEILEYFPKFEININSGFAIMVFRDMTVANIFIADVAANGDAIVRLNYTIPKYRDYKVGKYLFELEKEFLITNGLKKITYNNLNHAGHIRFINALGFSKGNDAGNYFKILN